MCPKLNSLHKNIFSRYDLPKTLLVGMDHGKGLKNRGTFASEASGPQKLEKLHLGGNLKFFGYGSKYLIIFFFPQFFTSLKSTDKQAHHST